MINTSRQLGGPIGVASLLTVAALLDPASSGPQPYAGLVTGMQYAFLAAAVLAVIAVLLSYSLRSKGQSAPEGAEETGRRTRATLGSAPPSPKKPAAAIQWNPGPFRSETA